MLAVGGGSWISDGSITVKTELCRIGCQVCGCRKCWLMRIKCSIKEDLSLMEEGGTILVAGPFFKYRIPKQKPGGLALQYPWPWPIFTKQPLALVVNRGCVVLSQVTGVNSACVEQPL